MTRPDHDDVVVREKHGNPRAVYLLGRSSSPDESAFRERDQAVWLAFLYAQAQRVRAWYAKDDGTFVLFGTFRNEAEEAPRSS